MTRISNLASVTVGDAISAAALSNSMIIDNTSRGVDYQGNEFAPYNSKSPYYHSGSPAGSTRKYRMAASLHFSRYYAGSSGLSRARGATTSKFDNYSQYVLATRGSAVVDLGGSNGRILSAIESHAGEVTSHGADGINWPVDGNLEPVDTWTQGIYDPQVVDIANAHNYGLGHMPKREFMNENTTTTELVTNHIASRIQRRVIDLDNDNLV